MARSAVTMFPVTDKAVILIHYMMDGNVSGDSDIFISTGLMAGTHHMYYIPEDGSHTVSFQQGQYHSILIEIPAAFITHAATRMTALNTLSEALDNNSKTGIQLPPAAIDFRIRTLLTEITAQHSSRMDADLLVQARIYELIWLYLLNMEGTGPDMQSEAYKARMQQVRIFIDAHIGDELNTSVLAKRFTISKTTLKRQFKGNFGKTIRDYIIARRMTLARELLLHADVSISSVGSQVGYAEFSSFSRAFKKYFGYAPMTCRKDQDRTNNEP